jgi:hypothetical protein
VSCEKEALSPSLWCSLVDHRSHVRAVYFMLKRGEPFDPERFFAH